MSELGLDGAIAKLDSFGAGKAATNRRDWGERIVRPPVDEEWDRFPRTSFRFATWVIALDPSMSADVLFRHRLLNHGDRYIPKTERDGLDMLLRAIRPDLQLLHEAHMAIAVTEAADVLDHVPTQRVTPLTGRWFSSGPLKDVKLDGYRMDRDDPMVLIPHDGGMVGVRHRDLPATRGIIDRKLFVACDLGGAIILWFRERGLCPSALADEIVADVFAVAEMTRTVGTNPVIRQR